MTAILQADIDAAAQAAAAALNGGSVSFPGRGWSNGDIQPQMFAYTREGKLQLYSGQRRWLHLAHGWSRIGTETGGSGKRASQYSRRVSFSNQGNKILEDRDSEARSVRSLIAQLCEQFYRNGWATGTGGGVCIRVGGPEENRPWRVFVAPSGLQKEDMIGDDIFELDMNQNVVVPPKTTNLRLSACTPLWFTVFKHRPSVKSVIHTHSMYAQIATLLDPTETSEVLSLTHLEMLKGVGHHAYDDMLEIPIIDNRPSEDLLANQLEMALAKYPNCNCVLVRRHGAYVWGDSWEQAKTQAESFDYLFQSAIEMRKVGLDFSQIPSSGTYRVDTSDEPLAKRQKITNGFNGVEKNENAKDLALTLNQSPILPRDANHLLLDIEGCTTSISFVKDTLYPFSIENLKSFVNALSPTDYDALANALRADLTKAQAEEIDTTDCTAIVKYMVRNDMKVASLKDLQGRIWKDGYEKGVLKGDVFPDFLPMLQWATS